MYLIQQLPIKLSEGNLSLRITHAQCHLTAFVFILLSCTYNIEIH